MCNCKVHVCTEAQVDEADLHTACAAQAEGV